MGPHTIQKCEEALVLLRSGLAMIDEAGGPLDVGAHLDLAISRLEQAIKARSNDTPASQKI